MDNQLMKLGFLASNNGSSMRAIVAAIEAGELAAEPRLVVSNKGGAPALAFAREHGIQARSIPTVADPAGADTALDQALVSAGVDLVILSGYLRRIGPKTLTRYNRRILNVHPALLPRFGGQGMYGARVHQAVRQSGETRTGASIHLVDSRYDHGEVVAQAEVAIDPNDTAETIEDKVMALEPKLFVATLQRIVEGSLPLMGDL
jgi:phosphoribosylglycinamide formyltransferase 1